MCLLMLMLVILWCAPSRATVEWDIQRTLKLKTLPRDVAVSSNGRWIYVLDNQGSILIYSPAGVLTDKIEIGKHVDQIKAGPREDLLVLMSRERQTVELLSIDFIRKINVSGAPFKGPANAPVVVAVFSEFQ